MGPMGILVEPKLHSGSYEVTKKRSYNGDFMGVSENGGSEYSTLNSRILLIRTPKEGTPNFIRTPKEGTPNFGKLPYVNPTANPSPRKASAASPGAAAAAAARGALDAATPWPRAAGLEGLGCPRPLNSGIFLKSY